jgi:hypothetical protein
LVASSKVGDDTEWATDLVGELGDKVELGIALDLDMNKDKIAKGKGGGRAASIDTITMGGTSVSNDEGNNLVGKVDVHGGLANVGEDGGAGVGQQASSGVGGGKGKIKGKFKFLAHGRNTADNVS